MTKNEFISKWKIHLLFGGGFLVAVAFTVAVNIIAGERFPDAAWSAIRGIKPIEIVMLISFWYAWVFHQPKSEWNGSFTTLNLRRSREKENL